MEDRWKMDGRSLDDRCRIPKPAGSEQPGQADGLPACPPIALILPSSGNSICPRYNGLSIPEFSAWLSRKEPAFGTASLAASKSGRQRSSHDNSCEFADHWFRPRVLIK